MVRGKCKREWQVASRRTGFGGEQVEDSEAAWHCDGVRVRCKDCGERSPFARSWRVSRQNSRRREARR